MLVPLAEARLGPAGAAAAALGFAAPPPAEAPTERKKKTASLGVIQEKLEVNPSFPFEAPTGFPSTTQ